MEAFDGWGRSEVLERAITDGILGLKAQVQSKQAQLAGFVEIWLTAEGPYVRLWQ